MTTRRFTVAQPPSRANELATSPDRKPGTLGKPALLQPDRQPPPRRETDAIIRAPLTPRERKLVRALLDGRTNRQIAEGFGTREQTVKNQLTTLFRKLGVCSRLQLVTLPVAALRALLGD